MSDVATEPIRWLWPNRIPLGKLSLLCGIQGQGKTFVALDAIARITSGQDWPDDCGSAGTGSAVILMLEDGLGDTIRPRLEAMGADLRKVVAIEGVTKDAESGPSTFNIRNDIRLLEKKIEELGDVRLVVVDPLTAYVGGQTDVHKDSDVRAALYPLGELAKRQNVAIVGVMHFRKAASDKALFRVIGSVAFTAFARAVWLIGDDRDDSECRLLLPSKMNIAKPAPGLRFKIVDPGMVEWLGTTDVTDDDAFASDERREPGPSVKAAMDWLKPLLMEHGSLSAKNVAHQAKDAGFSWRTVQRAQTKLGIKPTNGRVIGAEWVWSLPSPDDSSQQD